MKIKLIILASYLLVSVFCRAQIRFLDADSKLPIPSLNIYHETGKLIGFTDKGGTVQFLEGLDVKGMLPVTLTVQHISYTTKSLKINSLSEEQIYMLTSRAIVLDDVIVSAKPKEVIVLRGYYRSLETFDHQHKYFSDGIIEFYIPFTKGKSTYQLIDYRIFIDSTVTADYNTKMGPFFQIPRVVEMSSQKLSDRLKNLVQANDGTNRIRLLKKGKDVGYLTKSTDDIHLQLYIDRVLPDSVVKEKIFRIEARTLHEVHIENYTSTVLNDITPVDLISLYQNIVGSIKRKSELGHIPYEGLNEFYVLESRYISMSEYKSIQKKITKSIYKTPKRSVYKGRFWEDLEKYHIPAVNSGLAKQLQQSLKLVN